MWLPILLKGTLRPGDARRAIDAGVGSTIVANHGGRQLVAPWVCSKRWSL